MKSVDSSCELLVVQPLVEGPCACRQGAVWSCVSAEGEESTILFQMSNLPNPIVNISTY